MSKSLNYDIVILTTAVSRPNLHSKVFENVIRHLKHTCHALDPNVVIERPIPAPEIGLNKAIKYYISKNEETSIYQLISSATDKFANLCRNNLYTDSEKKLLSIAKECAVAAINI